MTRKYYINDYSMPAEIEKAALAFSEALKHNGFDSGNVSACPPLGSVEVHLYTWQDSDIDSAHVELRDGRWREYEFGGGY